MFFGAAVAAFVLMTNGVVSAQRVSGAIFTTRQDGYFVNGNVYDSVEDVYLNGGPRPNAPCTAAGLPNGDYYFQVTDPSGTHLLSLLDGVNIDDGVSTIERRRVRVEGGIIVFAFFHNTGVGQCSDKTVQLWPFMTTPNPGGEYKVWMTPAGEYDWTRSSGSFGFIPSKSKTDNFKVVPPVDLDSDGDGFPDSEDECPNDPNCPVAPPQ
jgi:hypothetical protein